MIVLGAFPDVEAALCDGLADLGTTGTVTPADLQDHLPFIRIYRTSGPGTRLADNPHVDIDVFAATATDAKDVAAQIYQRLLAIGPLVFGGVLIDSVAVDVGPRELPWGDPGLRRWSASYGLTVRRS